MDVCAGHALCSWPYRQLALKTDPSRVVIHMCASQYVTQTDLLIAPRSAAPRIEFDTASSTAAVV